MSERPTVALVMPPALRAMMFREGDLGRLKAVAEVVGPFEREDLAGLQGALGRAAVVITGWGSPRFDEELLGACERLRMLAHSAGSVKGVVTDGVFARGIRVTSAAAANAVPVAHYTVAMMVSLLKQIPWLTREMAHGRTREQMVDRVPYIRELQDIEVGLIGASRVGREVIKLLKCYAGVRVKLYDPYVKEEEAERMGVRLASLEAACACEVVSLHAPNITETRHMMNARTLALLPDHGVLINTSRGALIDENALIAEVRRRPLYVMLDVTDPEPPAADSAIRREQNILLTPHIAGSMKQARLEMGKLTIDEVLRFLRGETLEHEVTRQMLPTQA